MLDMKKMEKAIMFVLILLIIILIDMVIRNSQFIDICYLLFLVGCFFWFLYLKNHD